MKKTLLGCIAALLLVACGDNGSSGYRTTIHVDFKDERMAPLIIADGKFFEPHWQQNRFIMYNKLEVDKTYNVWIDGYSENGLHKTYLIWDVQEVK